MKQGWNVREFVPEFTLQWHITSACSKQCLHCYMRDDEGRLVESPSEMDVTDELRVVDDLAKLAKAWRIRARINFTGGDPLFNPRLFELMEYACKRKIRLGILGNTEQLSASILARMKSLNLVYYQVSLDGLENRHDHVRGHGDFRNTLRGLRLLREQGIPSAVMFTLTRANKDDLSPVIDLVISEQVGFFDFDRIVSLPFKRGLSGEMLSPEEFRMILEQIDQKYISLASRGVTTKFGRKDPLWTLYFYETGRLSLKGLDQSLIYTGCSIGINGVSLLPDGTLYACRRLPIAIGNVKVRGGLRRVFIESTALNQMREDNALEGCRNCELRSFCRGCRAIAFGASGLYTKPDPQCWRNVSKGGAA